MKQLLAILSVIMGMLIFYWRSQPEVAFSVLAVFMAVWGLITFGDQAKN